MASHSNSDPDAEFERRHVWHPYGPLPSPIPALWIESAKGTRLRLRGGGELIDAMSSWWAAIHGYAHPVLDAAVREQLGKMSHVMFGGLTHEPALRLARRLIEITPEPLECVFFADSGSVSVEVALKMALQYWAAVGRGDKRRLLTVRGGYHGDTLGAMSVCDPDNGLHRHFAGIAPEPVFVDRPEPRFGEMCSDQHLASLWRALEKHHRELAAMILEPVVQGAGGMRFYSAEYLSQARRLCSEFEVLLIADEIATGFGRSGALLGCDHAGVAPDIMCVGKALTGGYLSAAATLTTREVADAISKAGSGLMHGPTFMANPLACAVSLASIDLLLGQDWRARVRAIESQLQRELAPCAAMPGVVDVRVLGAIGVVELAEPIDMARATRLTVESGVWLRPFGKLLYTMPPYIIEADDLSRVTGAMQRIASGE